MGGVESTALKEKEQLAVLPSGSTAEHVPIMGLPFSRCEKGGEQEVLTFEP